MNPVLLNQMSLNLEHRQDSSGMVEIKTPAWMEGVVLARDRKENRFKVEQENPLKRVKLPLVEK